MKLSVIKNEGETKVAQIIARPKTYPIEPQHIDTSRPFSGVFESTPKDIAAHYIVRLCQRLGVWGPFSLTQIQDLYAESKHGNDFSFCGLMGTLIVLGDDGFYRITHEFVTACFRSSPKSTVFRSEPSIPNSPTGEYIVKLWDGSDRQWIDASGIVDKKEAIAIWNTKTKDGTERTCYEDFDYFAIFSADTK